MTEIRPLVAPIDWSSFALTEIVTVSPEVFESDLLRQNFTVMLPLKPVPVMMRVPPPESEIEVVDREVIDGGVTVEVSSEVAPLRAMVDPLPT
jgi:hypothetical protein